MTQCSETAQTNGRRCEREAGHDGPHDFIGVPHTVATMGRAGLPYASSGIDSDGYYVVCPACSLVIRGQGSDPAKSANRAYAKHYEMLAAQA